MRICGLAGVAVLALSGCTVGGGIQVKKVAFVLPPGGTKAESDEKDVCLSVPAGWRQGVDKLFDVSGFTAEVNNAPDMNGPIDPNHPPMTADDKKAMNEFAKTLDDFSKDEEEQHLGRLKKKGIVLMCISTSKMSLTEDRTRFYVKKETQNSNWTWEAAARAQQEKFNGAVTPKMVTLPIGQAYRMEQSWPTGNGATHTIVAYAIPNGRDLYSLRFITEEPREVVTTIEKHVTDSLRIN